MKLFTGIFLLAIFAMAVAAPAEKEEDEGVDVEEVLSNRRLLLAYIKCALGTGKCSSSGKDMKEHIKESLESNCDKCNEKQKKDNKLVFKHLINKEKDYWTQLVSKYDAPKKYAPKFEELYLGKE